MERTNKFRKKTPYIYVIGSYSSSLTKVDLDEQLLKLTPDLPLNLMFKDYTSSKKDDSIDDSTKYNELLDAKYIDDSEAVLVIPPNSINFKNDHGRYDFFNKIYLGSGITKQLIKALESKKEVYVYCNRNGILYHLDIKLNENFKRVNETSILYNYKLAYSYINLNLSKKVYRIRLVDLINRFNKTKYTYELMNNIHRVPGSSYFYFKFFKESLKAVNTRY